MKLLPVFAFTVGTSSSLTYPRSGCRINTSISMDSSSNRAALDRRQVGLGFIAATSAALINPTQSAMAASTDPPSKDDVEKIRKGYNGILYLLENWEKETTICRENGGECKRDAEPVRRYMGLRSTTDPLFQVEKTFAKVKNLDLDLDVLEEFFEATEEWNTAVNMSNSMAFISQFGEYNPGGGKDEVLKYLNESQKQVISAEASLKKILACIDSAQ